MDSSIAESNNLPEDGWLERASEDSDMSQEVSAEGTGNPHGVATWGLFDIEGAPPEEVVAAGAAAGAAAAGTGEQAAPGEAIFDPRAAQRRIYGVVTVPLNGPGAGLVFDQATKAAKLCTRDHAKPQQLCTAGVMQGHENGKAGWCVFAHGQVPEKVKKSKVGGSSRRRHMEWGKVNKPVGGRGAALVVDGKSKVPLKCLHFHATPRGSCELGVPAGDKSGQAGLCVYKH